MLKALNFSEICEFGPNPLAMYLKRKYTVLMAEYELKDINDIGCVIILEKEEANYLFEGGFEFVELLVTKELSYLHAVKIIGDSYAEDIYMPIEVKEI